MQIESRSEPPLSQALCFHHDQLIEAAEDGDLFNSKVTVVPSSTDMKNYIDRALKARDEGREFPFVIVDMKSHRVVGSTRYRQIEMLHKRLEIGATFIARSSQRTGVNTEAKLLLLSNAFEKLNCIRVEIITDILNEQSNEAIQRLGATKEGILRSHMLMPGGRVRDSVLYSIISVEWPTVKEKIKALLRSKVNRNAYN